MEVELPGWWKAEDGKKNVRRMNQQPLKLTGTLPFIPPRIERLRRFDLLMETHRRCVNYEITRGFLITCASSALE